MKITFFLCIIIQLFIGQLLNLLFQMQGQSKQNLIESLKDLKIRVVNFYATGKGYQYTLQITQRGKSHKTYKNVNDFRQLYSQLCQVIFELDNPFKSNILNFNQQDPLAVQIQLNNFFDVLTARLDVVTNEKFREFFKLSIDEINLQVLICCNKFQSSNKQNKIIDFAWQAKDQILFTIQVPHKIVKKITNFIKTLFSKQTKNGIIRLNHFHNKSWSQKFNIVMEGEPIKIHWSRKNAMLTVATNIGIYIYRVYAQQNYNKYQLFAFSALEGIVSCFCYQLPVITYIITEKSLYIYSVKQEMLKELYTKLNDVQSLVVQENEKRIFLSDRTGLHILDIEEPKFVKYLMTILNDTSYVKLIIGGKKGEYLFGLSKKGYICIMQLKPKGKQKLIMTLTNIETPQNSICLCFSIKHQLMMTEYKNNIVLITSKNIPLFSQQTNKKSQFVTNIYYDQIHQEVVVCSDNIYFYKLNLTQKMIF